MADRWHLLFFFAPALSFVRSRFGSVFFFGSLLFFVAPAAAGEIGRLARPPTPASLDPACPEAVVGALSCL